MPGSDMDKSRKNKGKKKASSGRDDRKAIKSGKGPAKPLPAHRQPKAGKGGRKTKKIDEVDEDSDLDEALRPG